MRLDLVPERHGGHEIIALDEDGARAVGEYLLALMLDFDPQRLVEHHRVGQVEAVGGAAVAGFAAFPQRRAIEGAILLAEAPAVAEVILRARPAQAGLGLAVNEEEVVPLAIPGGGHGVHALDRADVMAAARDVRQQVIASHHAGMLLAVAGMEIRGVVRQRGMFLPVNVVVNGGARDLAFVGDGDAGGLAEGHGPVAVAPAALGRNANREGDKRFVHPVADTEEVAHRAFDARVFLAVPVNPQRQQAGIVRRPVGDGEPDVGDEPRPLQFRQRQRRADGNAPPVVVAVAPVGVGRGNAPGAKVFEPLQPRQGISGQWRGRRGKRQAEAGADQEQGNGFHINQEGGIVLRFRRAIIRPQPNLSRPRCPCGNGRPPSPAPGPGAGEKGGNPERALRRASRCRFPTRRPGCKLAALMS